MISNNILNNNRTVPATDTPIKTLNNTNSHIWLETAYRRGVTPIPIIAIAKSYIISFFICPFWPFSICPY